MRAILIWLFLAIMALSAELKIASFNVENLFDGKEQGSEYKDFRYPRWNDTLYHIKLEKIAAILREINADIIALQEIENDKVLADLAAISGYEYRVFSSTKGAPIGLGLLSRIKPAWVREFSVPRFKTRNVLEAMFFVDGASFSVFNVHFPAYNGGRGVPAAKEAAKVVARVAPRALNSIIMGDFNSPYGAQFILKGLLKNGEYKDLWDFIKDPKERYSHLGGQSFRAIDHILLSKGFFTKHSGLSFVKFLVFKDDRYKNYSDHLPIIAHIKVAK